VADKRQREAPQHLQQAVCALEPEAGLKDAAHIGLGDPHQLCPPGSVGGALWTPFS
jgi:hypothetical protein